MLRPEHHHREDAVIRVKFIAKGNGSVRQAIKRSEGRDEAT